MTIKSIANSIKKAKNIAIFGHVCPDLDCFGSAFSLKHILKTQLDKNVKVFIDGEMEENFAGIFYPNIIDTCNFVPNDYDLIIVVDTPNKKRIGKYAEKVIKHPNVIKIDHHEDDTNELTKNCYIDTNSASCAELVYLVIKELVKKIDPTTATYIYSGIIGDTNSFVNSNVNETCLEIASNLCQLGANLNLVINSFLKSNTMANWNLSKLVYEKTEFCNNFGIVGITLKELNKLGLNGEGNSKYANEIIYIKGIDIGCIFTEKSSKSFNCSFRSVEGYDVSEIAKKLGGGGHKCAAACVLNGNYKDVRSKILNAIKDYLNEVKRG